MRRTWVMSMIGAVLALPAITGAGWLMLRGQNSAAAAPTKVEQAGLAAASAAQTASPAPDFTVPTLDGKTFTLSAHRGKPVILFIMAYWCGTCVPEARHLARLHEQYRGRSTIVALDVDPSSTPERLERFRQAAGNPGYVWAFDRGNAVTRAYRVRALDSTFIISQTGELVYTDTVPTSYETLDAQLSKLLK